MAGRGRTVRLVFLCALGLVGGALAALPGGGAAACILTCPTTTSSTTTTTAPELPPAVSNAQAHAISDSAVTITATIDPNGQTTDWDVSLQPVSGDVGSPVTVSGGQLAGSGAMSVSRRARGLDPNVRYTASIEASNFGGQDDASHVNFTTRLEPKLPITLTVKHRVVVSDTEPGLVATIDGKDPYDSINLYFKPEGSRRYHFAGSTMTSTRRVRPLFEPDKNGTVRAVLTGHPFEDRHRFRSPSTSNSVQLIVFPRLVLSVTQNSSDPALADVDAFYVAHNVPHGYVGGPVYLYRSAQRSGPYERFAVLPLRHERNYYYGGGVGASTQLRASPPLWIRACVRHEPVPDMGTPFTDRGCGGLTLG